MSYPSLQEYNEAFQNIQLSINDPELKQGKVTTTGLGIPLALCGGFALTYSMTTSGSKYAVRCFHKQSKELETRYKYISDKIRLLNSKYFLNFEFLPKGIKVKGTNYPLVKMAWAKGETLGEFLDKNYKNSTYLKNLQISLKELANFLENNNISHGDISPDNIMVSNNGNDIQLIDYDGMFVEEIKSLGSSELGNRNFQHIKRTAAIFDKTLDRFSFILLNIAIDIIIIEPTMWLTTNSDANAIIFRANDFIDPESSKNFKELSKITLLTEKIKNFANICKTTFDKIPKLNEFIANVNIPIGTISFDNVKTRIAQYITSFPVLNASNYLDCLKYVGDKVELVGKIYEVNIAKTKFGKPYIFINFGDWRGNIVKITIWSEALSILQSIPDKSWEGKWITVTGLIEPPFSNIKFNYTHLSSTITKNNQLQLITETEAKFRLNAIFSQSTSSVNKLNTDILKDIKKVDNELTNLKNQITPKSNTNNPINITQSQKTNNQAILDNLKKNSQASITTGNKTIKNNSTNRNTINSSSYNNTNKKNNNCFIATAVYGYDAKETNLLRSWRDHRLSQNIFGKIFIYTYYKISPHLIPVIKKNPKLKQFIKDKLDILISYINKSN
jgi:hypothetical protein